MQAPYSGLSAGLAALSGSPDDALAELATSGQAITVEARVAAIEFVVAAQAIDLRAPGRLGLGTGRAYRMVRELVPFTQADGTLPADLEPLIELVTRGTLTPAA